MYVFNNSTIKYNLTKQIAEWQNQPTKKMARYEYLKYSRMYIETIKTKETI